MSSDKAATNRPLTQVRGEAIRRLTEGGMLQKDALRIAGATHHSWTRWRRLDATRDELTRELMRRFNLSDKQVVTIKRIAFEALTNQQLADLDGMGLTGMKTRMTEIFKKVGVKSRQQLIVKLHTIQVEVIRNEKRKKQDRIQDRKARGEESTGADWQHPRSLEAPSPDAG